MDIFSKLLAVIRGDARPKIASADPISGQAGYKVPTVKFDTERVTEAVKVDLKNNIKKIKEFDESSFEKIYEAALQSVSRGRDLGVLAAAIMDLKLPAMTKRRAGEIALSLNNKATALMSRDQGMSKGIKYGIWSYSGAPCQINPKKPSAKDIRQDAAHKAADGKRYELAKGMRLNGKFTTPGREEGCRCASRAIIPGITP